MTNKILNKYGKSIIKHVYQLLTLVVLTQSKYADRSRSATTFHNSLELIVKKSISLFCKKLSKLNSTVMFLIGSKIISWLPLSNREVIYNQLLNKINCPKKLKILTKMFMIGPKIISWMSLSNLEIIYNQLWTSWLTKKI